MGTKRAVVVFLLAALPGLAAPADTGAMHEQKGTTMNMEEPMAGAMSKPGMKKGDVRKHEEQWSRKMKGAIEQEQKSMPSGKGGKQE